MADRVRGTWPAVGGGGTWLAGGVRYFLMWGGMKLYGEGITPNSSLRAYTFDSRTTDLT